MTRVNQPLQIGLSFDDVLLIPQRTSATSRKLVDVSSQLTRRIRLQVPIVAANVPWCTEATMAIALAQLGGMGFIHRVNTAEQQAEFVHQVKTHPFSLSDYPLASVDQQGRLLVGAAVGIKRDWERRAEQLVACGADLLVIDIAHGHADYAIEAVATLKHRFPNTDIVAGNVATVAGTADLIRAGADAIKVGIGPGAVCTTRIVTGCGVPQITAILHCAAEARKHNISVIADGGIRTSGDLTKALAAGATTVMLGSLLAGTEESAARLVEIEGEKHKISTGFASIGMEHSLKYLEEGELSENELQEYVPEGVDTSFRYSGPLKTVLAQLIGGLKSGMSYCGSMSMTELHEKADFLQISPAGFAEGTPHILNQSYTGRALNYKDLRLQVTGAT